MTKRKKKGGGKKERKKKRKRKSIILRNITKHVKEPCADALNMKAKTRLRASAVAVVSTRHGCDWMWGSAANGQTEFLRRFRCQKLFLL